VLSLPGVTIAQGQCSINFFDVNAKQLEPSMGCDVFTMSPGVPCNCADYEALNACACRYRYHNNTWVHFCVADTPSFGSCATNVNNTEQCTNRPGEIVGFCGLHDEYPTYYYDNGTYAYHNDQNPENCYYRGLEAPVHYQGEEYQRVLCSVNNTGCIADPTLPCTCDLPQPGNFCRDKSGTSWACRDYTTQGCSPLVSACESAHKQCPCLPGATLLNQATCSIVGEPGIQLANFSCAINLVSVNQQFTTIKETIICDAPYVNPGDPCTCPQIEALGDSQCGCLYYLDPPTNNKQALHLCAADTPTCGSCPTTLNNVEQCTATPSTVRGVCDGSNCLLHNTQQDGSVVNSVCAINSGDCPGSSCLCTDVPSQTCYCRDATNVSWTCMAFSTGSCIPQTTTIHSQITPMPTPIPTLPNCSRAPKQCPCVAESNMTGGDLCRIIPLPGIVGVIQSEILCLIRVVNVIGEEHEELECVLPGNPVVGERCQCPSFEFEASCMCEYIQGGLPYIHECATDTPTCGSCPQQFLNLEQCTSTTAAFGHCGGQTYNTGEDPTTCYHHSSMGPDVVCSTPNNADCLANVTLVCACDPLPSASCFCRDDQNQSWPCLDLDYTSCRPTTTTVTTISRTNPPTTTIATTTSKQTTQRKTHHHHRRRHHDDDDDDGDADGDVKKSASARCHTCRETADDFLWRCNMKRCELELDWFMLFSACLSLWLVVTVGATCVWLVIIPRFTSIPRPSRRVVIIGKKVREHRV
jgi:hypothetical protein